jgi:hypothetical protein
LYRHSLKNQHKPSRLPDLANVAYGPHERNVFDLWKAKSDTPTPLVIFIHGGGFVAGDKNVVSSFLVDYCLEHGVSVAAINYRYSTQAPYPAPMQDGARAVQFLRLHAGEYNLNPKPFGATGGSAGAGISLWIGFTMTWQILNRTILSTFPRYEDGSAVTHLTADDPPVFLLYTRSNTPPPPGDLGTGIHHPRFGYFLKEKMDKLRIECIVKTKDDYAGKPPGQPQRDQVDFFVKHFPVQ